MANVRSTEQLRTRGAEVVGVGMNLTHARLLLESQRPKFNLLSL